MHPQLTLHNNPMCVEQILALKKCHEESGWLSKLLGACNEDKTLLDRCFKAQKKVTRKPILEAARADRERWHQKCDAIDLRRAKASAREPPVQAAES
jgi:COX assembly protein 2